MVRVPLRAGTRALRRGERCARAPDRRPARAASRLRHRIRSQRRRDATHAAPRRWRRPRRARGAPRAAARAGARLRLRFAAGGGGRRRARSRAGSGRRPRLLPGPGDRARASQRRGESARVCRPTPTAASNSTSRSPAASRSRLRAKARSSWAASGSDPEAVPAPACSASESDPASSTNASALPAPALTSCSRHGAEGRRRTCREQRQRGLRHQAGRTQSAVPGRPRRRAAVPSRHSEEQRHGVGLQAPRGKHERLRRGRIEPLRVIGNDEQRARLRRVRQQTKCARRHRAAPSAHCRTQRKRGAQRRSLRRRDLPSAARIGRQASNKPEKAMSAFASTPTTDSTCISLARAMVQPSKLLFPIPASPHSTSVSLRPSRARSSSRSISRTLAIPSADEPHRSTLRPRRADSDMRGIAPTPNLPATHSQQPHARRLARARQRPVIATLAPTEEDGHAPSTAAFSARQGAHPPAGFPSRDAAPRRPTVGLPHALKGEAMQQPLTPQDFATYERIALTRRPKRPHPLDLHPRVATPRIGQGMLDRPLCCEWLARRPPANRARTDHTDSGCGPEPPTPNPAWIAWRERRNRLGQRRGEGRVCYDPGVRFPSRRAPGR